MIRLSYQSRENKARQDRYLKSVDMTTFVRGTLKVLIVVVLTIELCFAFQAVSRDEALRHESRVRSITHE